MAFKHSAARSVIITRPYSDAVILSAKLAELGINSIIDPMLTVCRLKTPIVITNPTSSLYAQGQIIVQNLGINYCIITSKQAVFALKKYQVPFTTPIFVVAISTAELVRQQGYHNVLIGNGYAASLIPMIAQQVKQKDANIIYFCGQDTRFDFITALTIYQYNVIKVVLYKTESALSLKAGTISMIKQDKISAILFYSPKTVRTFCQLSSKIGLNMDKVIAICLSHDIAQSISIPFANIIAARYPNDDMIIQTLQNEVSHG